jgi:hypothetical protein
MRPRMVIKNAPVNIVVQREFGKSESAICQVCASFYDSRPFVPFWLERPGHGSRQRDNKRDKRATAASFHFHYKSVEAKPDLHFCRNGTSHTPEFRVEIEVRQFGKLTTAVTISKKHVRRCDRRTHSRWDVPAPAASSRLLITANRWIQNQTYISVGMVPSRLQPSQRYVNSVS